MITWGNLLALEEYTALPLLHFQHFSCGHFNPDQLEINRYCERLMYGMAGCAGWFGWIQDDGVWDVLGGGYIVVRMIPGADVSVYLE